MSFFINIYFLNIKNKTKQKNEKNINHLTILDYLQGQPAMKLQWYTQSLLSIDWFLCMTGCS